MGAKTVTFKLAPWTHMNPYEVLAHFNHEKWVAWMQVLSSWLWPKHSCFCVFQSHGLTLLVTRWKLMHIKLPESYELPRSRDLIRREYTFGVTDHWQPKMRKISRAPTDQEWQQDLRARRCACHGHGLAGSLVPLA